MAKIEKMDREQVLYIIAQEFGDDKEGWEQLAVEMVKAMSDTQAREILGYIAKNWDIDTMGYEASAKKSKSKILQFDGKWNQAQKQSEEGLKMAKDVKKSASTNDYIEKINDLLGSLLGQIHYDYPSVADEFNKDIDNIREKLFDMKNALTYTDAGLLESTKKSKSKLTKRPDIEIYSSSIKGIPTNLTVNTRAFGDIFVEYAGRELNNHSETDNWHDYTGKFEVDYMGESKTARLYIETCVVTGEYTGRVYIEGMVNGSLNDEISGRVSGVNRTNPLGDSALATIVQDMLSEYSQRLPMVEKEVRKSTTQKSFNSMVKSIRNKNNQKKVM